jgi:uncharacterized protein (TIGR03083 family)
MVMTGRLPATTPRRPQMDRALAMRLANTEYERVADLLRRLTPFDWGRPTDCPAWDVRAMAAHTLGMAEMAASMRESARQNWLAHRRGGLFIDALTSVQVEKHRSLSPEGIVDRMAAIGPRAVRGRRRTPRFIRGIRMPIDQLVGDTTEPWTFGYLIDVILTRDPWMHRVDISRAIDRPMVLTSEHDGILVADVVMEWASRHGEACTLILTGPAGGEWSFGHDAGPRLELDAVEFCRILSGRASGTGLLSVQVPF